jgi:hypothetical protein
MSITFNQAIAQWAGTPPVTSTSFTPNAAGDTIVLCSYVGATGYTATFTGTGGTYTVSGTLDGTASSVSYGYCLSVSSGAQTATVNSAAGFMDGVFALDYYGVGSISGVQATHNATPGAGTGACAGVSVSVATGSVLVAACLDLSSLGASETITSPSGTQRAIQIGNVAYLAVDYAGSGGSIQPTFTCPDGATNDYMVVQWTLSSTAPNTATIAWIT